MFPKFLPVIYNNINSLTEFLHTKFRPFGADSK